MEVEKNFRKEEAAPANRTATLHSIGDSRAKFVPLIESQEDLAQQSLPKKKGFLPFLYERDGMNRLVTLPSRYDPDRLGESANPSLYYKSERFNKYVLRIENAEKNKHSIGKLLHDSKSTSGPTNFLEQDKSMRLKKLKTKKSMNILAEEWKRSETETPQNKGDTLNKYLYGLDPLGAENLQKMITTEGMPLSFLKGINDLNISKKKNNAETNRNLPQNSKMAQKKSQSTTHRLFLPSDDFSNFYKKLDDDIRNIPPNVELRRAAQNNVACLNNVAKKYKKVQREKEETWLSSLTPNSQIKSSQEQKLPRMKNLQARAKLNAERDSEYFTD